MRKDSITEPVEKEYDLHQELRLDGPGAFEDNYNSAYTVYVRGAP